VEGTENFMLSLKLGDGKGKEVRERDKVIQ